MSGGTHQERAFLKVPAQPLTGFFKMVQDFACLSIFFLQNPNPLMIFSPFRSPV